MGNDDLIPLPALQHYLYCSRQCALIHIEQLWAENRYTAEGRLLHERADQPHTEQRHGVCTATAMPLDVSQTTTLRPTLSRTACVSITQAKTDKAKSSISVQRRCWISMAR